MVSIYSLEEEEEEEEEEYDDDDEQSALFQFSSNNHCSCVFTLFESIAVYRSTRRACCVSEKA